MSNVKGFLVVDNGKMFATAEQAMKSIIPLIYVSEKGYERCLNLLNQGHDATIVYGFASIQIQPIK